MHIQFRAVCAFFAILTAVAPLALAEEEHARMRFENKLDYAVRVLVVDVDNSAKVYKSASIAPGKGNGFTWGCQSRRRAFLLYRADDGAESNVLASGTFGFYTSSDGGLDCQARVYGADDDQTSWESTQINVSYSKPGNNRGRFTFAPRLKDLPRLEPR